MKIENIHQLDDG